MATESNVLILIKRLAIVSGVYVYAASNALLSGGLGPVSRDYGITELQVGIILSLGALAVVPTAPLWGVLSERVGRRSLVLTAIPFVLLSPLIMALVFSNMLVLASSATVYTLAVARTVKGVFGGALIPSTQALIADTTDSKTRVSGMGLMGASVSLGALSGSMLLWLTAERGIAVGFVALLLAGLFAFFLSLKFLPTSQLHIRPRTKKPIRLSRFWKFFAITMAGFAGYTMVVPIIGLKLMDDLQVNSTEAMKSTGFILAGATLSLTISQVFVATRKGWDARRLLRSGSIGALAGIGIMILADDVLVLAIGMIAVGASLGAVAPGAMGALSLSAGTTDQGRVAGINTAFRGMGIAAGPVLGTALYSFGTDAPLWGALALVFCVAALSLSCRQPNV